MPEQLDHLTLADALITPTIVGGFGGFGTSALAALEKMYFSPGQLPEGLVAYALDTCDQNPFGQRVDKGQIRYHELSFENPAAALEEMLRQHPEWLANLDPERLRFDRVRIATSGVLKHHARLLATALKNRAVLDQIGSSTHKALSDQANPRLNHGLLETISFAGGAGGTGLPLAVFKRLREHARNLSGSITAWHEGWFLGPGNYPPHQVMTRWYQMNFATEIKFLGRVVAHGTSSGDPRFSSVLPGFEDLLDISAGAGKGRLLPGAFDHIMVFDAKSTKGKSLPIESLLEMMGGCAFWRSRLPMLSGLIRELIIETRDKRAEAENEEGVSYCFGGCGGRFIELHPQLPAIGRALTAHHNANAILAGKPDGAPPVISFNLNRFEEAAADWREELNRHDLRLTSQERLAATMAANPRSEISRLLKRIEDMEEGIRAVIDQRGLDQASLESLQAELAAAINTAKRQFGLRAVEQPIAQLKADIAALIQAPTFPLAEGWKERIWQLADPILPNIAIDDAEELIIPSEIGLWRAIWLNLIEKLTRSARREGKSQTKAVSMHPAFSVVVHDLLAAERAMRDYMINMRKAAIGGQLAAYLESQLDGLEQQIFEAQRIGEASLEQAKTLLQSGSSQSAARVRYTVQPSLPWLLEKTAPPPDMVRTTWERIEGGTALGAAVSYEVGDTISFTELVAADPELVKFLRWSVRDVAPHVAVKSDEMAEVPEQYFLVYPEEMKGYIEGLNLHLVGPWIKLPVAGLQAIVIYAIAYGLPARGLQSAADCEPALREGTDAERYESSLFPEWRRLPSVFAADRRATEEIVAAAMLLHANIQQWEQFPFAINQVNVVGEPFPANPCPFQQDDKGQYQVKVTVPGGQIHYRPLRTDSFRVAVDLVNDDKGKYLDPLRRHLAECAAGSDYLADEVLRETIKQIGVWIEEHTIKLEDQEFSQLGADAQKIAAAETAVLPIVEDIHRALKRFVDADWIAHYKRVHEGKVLQYSKERRPGRRRVS